MIIELYVVRYLFIIVILICTTGHTDCPRKVCLLSVVGGRPHLVKTIDRRPSDVIGRLFKQVCAVRFVHDWHLEGRSVVVSGRSPRGRSRSEPLTSVFRPVSRTSAGAAINHYFPVPVLLLFYLFKIRRGSVAEKTYRDGARAEPKTTA